MNDSMLFVVIGVAFVLGYVVVNALFSRLGKDRQQKSAEPVLPISSQPGDRKAYYRQVLGLKSPYTWGELERSYQARLAECNPERLRNLGDEVHQAAAGRLALVNEAYAYLRSGGGHSD